MVLFLGRSVSQRGLAWPTAEENVEELRSRIVRGEEESRKLRDALGELRARFESRQGDGVVRKGGDADVVGDKEDERMLAEERAEELKLAKIEAEVERDEYLASMGGVENSREGVVVKENLTEEVSNADERKKEIKAIERASEILLSGSVQSPGGNGQVRNNAAPDITPGSAKSSADMDVQVSPSKSLEDREAEAEILKNESEEQDLLRAREKTEEYRRAYNVHRAHVQMRRARGGEKKSGGQDVIVEGGTVERPDKSVAEDAEEGAVQAETQTGESHPEGVTEGENSASAKKAEVVFEKRSNGVAQKAEGDLKKEVETGELIELQGASAEVAGESVLNQVGEVILEENAAAAEGEAVVLKGDE